MGTEPGIAGVAAYNHITPQMEAGESGVKVILRSIASLRPVCNYLRPSLQHENKMKDAYRIT